MSSESPQTSSDESSETNLTWNDQVIESCAHFLRKSVKELRDEYQNKFNSPSTAFPDHNSELLPRDFTDFIIIAALKANLSSKKKNLCAWYFNLMDRTGSGYVLKEEFVRYSPYMSPVSDEAMSSTIFSILLETQQENDEKSSPSSSSDLEMKKIKNKSANDVPKEKLRSKDKNLMFHKTERRTLKRSTGESASPVISRKKFDASQDLLPSAIALRYETWENYYESVIDNYHVEDPEWSRVKDEVGIDSDELLIKSENAVAHVDLFPSFGKLYLSQRYLVFHAAIGINHYVVRLGAVTDVKKASIPLLFRDVFEIILASETQSAKNGVTSSGSSVSRDGKSRRKESVPEHIEKIMKRFKNGRKPLVLSLMELGDGSKRDEWIIMIKEIVSAHELHRKMGFGNNGRVSHNLGHQNEAEESEGDNEAARSSGLSRSGSGVLKFIHSPFRNEPRTPLLVIAAHVNVAWYRSFSVEFVRKNHYKILIFSNPRRHERRIKWFVESVQKHDGWKERSWIKRVLSAVQENIDTNERLYNANDIEPVSIPVLTNSIGRFAELCSPLASIVQNCNYLFQWKNPSATVLAIMACANIVSRGLIVYIPSMIFLFVAFWVIEKRLSVIGLHDHSITAEDVREKQRNVFRMVAQVHDALQATQNVTLYLNKHLGKVQTLLLWRTDRQKSWLAVSVLFLTGIIFATFSGKMLFTMLTVFMFGKHFLPPSNPFLRFWESIPSNIDPS